MFFCLSFHVLTAAECSDIIINEMAETDNQEEESAPRADKEQLYSSEELNNSSEPDEEPEIKESKSSSLCFKDLNKCQNVSVAKQRLLLYFYRVDVLGAPRCAAAVEPLQFEGSG